jgi:hypothetical protein
MDDQTRESTSVLSGESVEIHSWFHHHEGSNDYTNSRTDIVAIEDREGRTLAPVWAPQWTSIAAGVETRDDGSTHRVRIAASACPIRVRFSDFHEYVSYTDSEHCSSSIRHYIVRYVVSV